MVAHIRAVVSAQWLANAAKTKLVGPKLRVLDGTYVRRSNRNHRHEFSQKHIQGASFFDLNKCCDKSSKYDNMLPTSSDFSRYVSDLGIGNDTHVVVYTSNFGSLSAPRVWWMFRVFGHSSVSVLDGGFKNWVADGHLVASDYTKPENRDFKASLNQSWVKSYEDVLENIKTKQVQVVDSRSAGRFRGTEPEAKEGYLLHTCINASIISEITPGGSTSIQADKDKRFKRPPRAFPRGDQPFTSLLDSSGKYHSTEELAKVFQQAGVDLEKLLWASCSLGITACHVILAAQRLGYSGVGLYDGSWTEFFKRAPPELIVSEGEGKKV